MRIRKPTIAARLILALLGCSVLLIVASVVLRFYYDYNREMRLLASRVHEVEQSVLPVMENSVWLADWEMVRVQAMGLQRLPAITRVAVVVDGREIVAIGEAAPDLAFRHTLPLVHRYKDRDVSLGTLTVDTDVNAIRQRLLDVVYVELALRLIVILIISSLLFFLFHRMAGRHLVAMASQLRDFGLERMGKPLVLDKKVAADGGMDEIDQVVFSFNAMQQRLQLSFVELQQANEGLSRENRQRLKVEEALRENRVMLRNILDTVPQAIFWKDRQSVYLGCNQVFAAAVGLDDPEQIVGKSDFDLPWPRLEAEAYRADDAEVVNSGQGKKHIIEPLQQADGVRLWIDTTKVPLVDGEGNCHGVLGVFTDITDRVVAEEEKAKLQAQLSQAQKMEAIGILAGGIAHDFNNILAAIMGYTEMARYDAPADSRLAHDLDNVLTATHRAKDLVKQILAFSRQSAVDRMPMKIQPLIKESLQMLRAAIPTTITIRENIHPQGGAILADPTQVHQIVMNLCTNAFQAMEDTGGVLAVEVKTTYLPVATTLGGSQLAPGEYVELTVSDTGTGTGPDIIDKIFDPYFTTKGVGKGTGMGLSITHGIIKSYGGAITVASTVGQGTTFQVYFPVIQEEARLPEESQAAPGGKERILFVDDEELLIKMGRELLERLGYTVTALRNGFEALETFRKDPAQFDLVITDQTMPGMVGAELAQRLLQIRPDVPIILCTGFSQQIDADAAKVIGVREFALKPLTKAAIAQLVRKVLDGEATS